jgi:hypothetical protein
MTETRLMLEGGTRLEAMSDPVDNEGSKPAV